MNGARKFHSPDGPAFYLGQKWVSSSGLECWILYTKRYGPGKWDVQVVAEYGDNSAFIEKDAWNFQVHYMHASDANLKVAPRYTPAYYDAEGGSMCNGIGREYF